MDAYYQYPEVSNSDLIALLKYFKPDYINYDPEIAFRFGNLVDYLITEPSKVNYFKRTIEGYEEPFNLESWHAANEMKTALNKEPFWKHIKPLATYQRIFRGPVTLSYTGYNYRLNMRCKYDFFMNALGWGGDIKSTAATTKKQFVDACYHFNYDQSRVLYMLLSGAQKDLIIGISKKNYKVFNFPIVRGDVFWNSGFEKLTEIAFRWYYIYENF